MAQPFEGNSFVDSTSAVIRGDVTTDLECNFVGDRPKANCVIERCDSPGAVNSMTTKIAVDGVYEFRAPLGSYTIEQIPCPFKYTPNGGVDSNAANPDIGNVTVSVVSVADGIAVPGIDFVEWDHKLNHDWLCDVTGGFTGQRLRQ